MGKFVDSLRLIHGARKTDAYQKRILGRAVLNIGLVLVALVSKNELGASNIYLFVFLTAGWLILEFVFRVYICYFVKND
jgi:hypothetical protein